MSTKEDSRPLSLHRPQGATESFTEYANSERQQRMDSGAEFDQALFDEAADLVKRKLEKLEDEGLA